MNMLEQLQAMTTIVADTGEIEEIKACRPTDATTNPSLILAAASLPQYKQLVEEALAYGKNEGKSPEEKLSKALDKVFVKFGLKILEIIPGRVSTEVDARLSFDIEGSVHKARTLISMYEAAGASRERILIKLASTWEGIQAAKILEKERIHCNMTLLFSLPQAICCAEAKATLISPFVGRILDWYKAAEGKSSYPPEEDPGVRSVVQIYHYFKNKGYKTQIMGASFRNIEEILYLSGCDLLTIAPKFLKELQQMEGTLPRRLDPEVSKKLAIKEQHFDEKSFRYELCSDRMASEKLYDGIRSFSRDIIQLENALKERL